MQVCAAYHPRQLNVRSCRIVDEDWQLGWVYFLAFLNPQGDNRSRPLPPGWPASATVVEPTTELD